MESGKCERCGKKVRMIIDTGDERLCSICALKKAVAMECAKHG